MYNKICLSKFIYIKIVLYNMYNNITINFVTPCNGNKKFQFKLNNGELIKIWKSRT